MRHLVNGEEFANLSEIGGEAETCNKARNRARVCIEILPL